MRNKYINIAFFFLIVTFQLNAQEIRISGHINDSSSGEPLIGANVANKVSNTGVATNNYGFFTLPVKTKNDMSLEFSYIGYEAVKISIDVILADTIINVGLTPGVELDEVVVTAGSTRIASIEQMSLMHVQISDFKLLPSLGESDAIKSLQLLPGVSTGGEGQSGLNIRGGSFDQTLFLLDGVPLYHVNHLGNYLSVFETEALKDIKLYKGAFPARYGGRLSSVIDIRTKEGNKYSTKGNFSLGLLSSSILLEGPIVKGKSSYIISFRRFWPDLLTVPIGKLVWDNGIALGYNFYDNIVKYNHEFSNKDKIFLSYYGGRDAYRTVFKEKQATSVMTTADRIKWGNQLVSAKWTHIFGPALFSEFTAGFTNYRNSHIVSYDYNETTSNLTELSYTEQLSSINDLSLNTGFEYSPIETLGFKFGGGMVYHLFTPGQTTYITDFIDTERSEETFGNDRHNTVENFLYSEVEYSPSDYLDFNIGMRWTGYGTGTNYYQSFEPRLAATFNVKNLLDVSASYSTMQQYIHLLTSSGTGMTSDLWLPSTSGVPPEKSEQFALGISKTIGQTGLSVSIEGYTKKMSGLVSFKEGASFFAGTESWEDKLEIGGEGRSKGIEFLVQKSTGKTTGWISYTLSKTTRQFENINNGREYPFSYDKPHDLAIVLKRQLTDNIDFSASWVYSTGLPVTIALSKYKTVTTTDQANANYPEMFLSLNDYAYLYGNKNSFRMRDYHRLDVGFNFSKEKKHGTRVWSVNIYNVYNRKNAIYYYFGNTYETVKGIDEYGNHYSYIEETGYRLKQMSYFPLMPSFTYSYRF
jgi:hypothetical protein